MESYENMIKPTLFVFISGRFTFVFDVDSGISLITSICTQNSRLIHAMLQVGGVDDGISIQLLKRNY